MKSQIFELVKQYYQQSPDNTNTKSIHTGGRVYNEKEMINLVDSALDFWLTSGKYTKQFEKKFTEYLTVKHCITVNSGSSANLLAISALTSPLLKERQVKPGDEIITTALAFPTTVNPIIQIGCIPVFVDTNPATLNGFLKFIQRAITKKTKAIFLAHTLGNPFAITEIKKLCEKHGLWLIGDCCDALGSKYNGKMVGTIEDIGTFSFYPAHHMTMGEGGAVATNNDLLKKIIVSMRDWGRDCECETGQDNKCGKRFCQQRGDLPSGYDHKFVYSHLGYNLKITDMQASIGIAQIDKLNKFAKIRERNYNYLLEKLSFFCEDYFLPLSYDQSEPNWFGFPIIMRNNKGTGKIIKFLNSKNIMTRPIFAGNIIRQPYFKNIKYKIYGNLQNTNYLMNNGFWIGIYPAITIKQLKYVVKTFKEYFK